MYTSLYCQIRSLVADFYDFKNFWGLPWVSQIKILYLTLLSDSFLGGGFTCDLKIYRGLRPQRVLHTFLYCQIPSLVDDFFTILKILWDSPERVCTFLYCQIHSLLADLLAI